MKVEITVRLRSRRPFHTRIGLAKSALRKPILGVPRPSNVHQKAENWLEIRPTPPRIVGLVARSAPKTKEKWLERSQKVIFDPFWASTFVNDTPGWKVQEVFLERFFGCPARPGGIRDFCKTCQWSAHPCSTAQLEEGGHVPMVAI